MPLAEEVKDQIVSVLRKELLGCCPPMVIAKDSKDGLEIMGNKPVPYGYNKKIIPGMYFSSYVVRKEMVSFYLFALYGHAEEFTILAPGAMKCLKGKTCFNFKKPEQVVKKEIHALLKKGMEIWNKQGYLK